MIKEKIKKFKEYQYAVVESNIKEKGILPIFNYILLIFIIYPLCFTMYYLNSEILNNRYFSNILTYLSIIIFIINIIILMLALLEKDKAGFLRYIGFYLMYIIGIFLSIIGFSGASGDYSLLGLKLALPFIAAFVSIILRTSLIDLDSKEYIKRKSLNKIYIIIYLPMVVLSLIFVTLAILGYDRFMSWCLVILSMSSSTMIYVGIFYIIYLTRNNEIIK